MWDADSEPMRVEEEDAGGALLRDEVSGALLTSYTGPIQRGRSLAMLAASRRDASARARTSHAYIEYFFFLTWRLGESAARQRRQHTFHLVHRHNSILY